MEGLRKVSVVIPCFNGGATIDEAIRSVHEQTYPNIEIVVVDDGSTDLCTIELLKRSEWANTRIVWKDNGGPASARNRGIAESCGEYVLPLDADDRIAATYIEQAVAVLDARADVGVVYCKAMRFGADSGLWMLPDYSERELTIDNVIFVTSLFRKADWTAVEGFSETLKHGVEDYDFWLKIVGGLNRAVVQLDEPLFFYRVQDVSRTTQFNGQRPIVVTTYADIFRNNIAFFARNAEYIFEHRFGIYDELVRYRARYARFDALMDRHVRVRRVLSGLWAVVCRVIDSRLVSGLRDRVRAVGSGGK
ncbi:glycosyltransferase family A protein [Luteimonas terrae]|uniref:Glycosyltransferase family 2 protein n=1 Tax=Luteimonas terrae TaxID=1530191 RepID=A0A4V3AN81_9GAMM|nr:glycosyltransferase family A protein [Luteimonas terrae]TDK29989.1 glycosyltransferase family 2 protein [Luteimonas terrae]